MKQKLNIRITEPKDLESIWTLYQLTFPQDDMRPFVQGLMRERPHVLSLSCLMGGALAGHVLFTRGRVRGGTEPIGLLGPLAVAPARQKIGVGRALTLDGVYRLAGEGITKVCVLGDPGYYSRLGFVAETAVLPPYPLAAKHQSAWQSKITGGGEHFAAGELSLPNPWRHPELWSL